MAEPDNSTAAADSTGADATSPPPTPRPGWQRAAESPGPQRQQDGATSVARMRGIAADRASTTAATLASRLHPDVPRLTEEEKAERTKLVGRVLGGVMLVALLLALLSLRGIANAPSVNDVLGDPNPNPTALAAASAQPSEPAAAAVAPVIATVSTRDPLGDNEENDDRVAAMLDNNPESTWASSTYRNSQFSGLKTGVGVLITLKETATVNTVTITQRGQGGAVEVRTAPNGTFEGSSVVSTVPMESPTTTIALGQKPTTNQLLLWFTEVPRTDGRYRIDISEITVS